MKSRILQILSGLVVIAVIDVALLVLVTERTNAFWITFGFIQFAFLFAVGSALLVPSGKDGAVLGYPNIMFGWTYFAIELALGLGLVLFGADSITLVFLTQFVLAGVFVFLLLSNLVGNERIADSTAVDEAHVDYVRQSVAAIKRMRIGVSDPGLDRRLEKLEEGFAYGQVSSDPSVADIESEIDGSLSQLSAMVSAGDAVGATAMCDRIDALRELRDTNLVALRRA